MGQLSIIKLSAAFISTFQLISLFRQLLELQPQSGQFFTLLIKLAFALLPFKFILQPLDARLELKQFSLKQYTRFD